MVSKQFLQFVRTVHDELVAFDLQQFAIAKFLPTRLLSVTLDPDYDTPKVLSDYAAFHHADPKIWTFATGDEKEIDSLTRAFSVYRQTEGGTISHGLATALMNRDAEADHGTKNSQ